MINEGVGTEEQRPIDTTKNVCCARPGQGTGHLHCDDTRLNIRPTKESVVLKGNTQFVEFCTGLVEGTTVMVESKRHLHASKKWVTPRTVYVVSTAGSVFLPVTNLGKGDLKNRE